MACCSPGGAGRSGGHGRGRRRGAAGKKRRGRGRGRAGKGKGKGKGKVKKTKPDIAAKAEGRFPKFHLLLHMAQYLLEFGSLDLTDTDRWETWHQWTKLIYFKTSGKFTKH